MPRTDRALAGVSVLAILAAGAELLAGELSWTALARGAALAAVGDLLRVRLTGARPSSLALAPGLALAFETHDPSFVVVAFALGTLATTLLRRPSRPVAPAGIHLLSVAAASVAVAAVAPHDPFLLVGGALGVLTLLAGVAALAGTDVLLRARTERVRPSSVAHALLPFHLAAASAAGLLALAEPVLGTPAATLLFLAPLLGTHHAFGQLESVRRTFTQMIGALSSVPEVAGYATPGHADRTARLSRALGRELRLRERELDEIETAARLHDLGRMRAPTPEAVDALPASEVAEGGAHVVRSTGALPKVAAILERSHEPFAGDESIPLAARIVRVASSYDDLTGTGAGALSPGEALRSMRRGDGRFDPRVLDALARIRS